MTLGEKLRMLRKNVNDFKLIDVARLTGISVSYLSDLERGQTRPSLETLEKLSDFYKVSVNELLDTIEKDRSANSDKVLPNNLQDLLKEIKIEPDILDLMLTVEQRSKNQPASKEDWRKYYYSLKMLLGR
jgi:transcriptional regulator with XRE-family HTH domain